MKNEIVIAPNSTEQTESLLQSLIAECHHIIRDMVLPSAQATADDTERRRYLASAVELVRIAATVGDTVARLRGGAAQETRQRITVERIERSVGQAALKGGGG